MVELSVQKKYIREQLEDIIGRCWRRQCLHCVLESVTTTASLIGACACRRDPAKMPAVDKLMGQFDCDGRGDERADWCASCYCSLTT